jgi:hypothetical protein
MQFASPHGRTTRFVAAASAALTFGIGLAACGGGSDDGSSGSPSKADIVKAMKADNTGDDKMTDGQIDCFAGVMQKYVKGDVLKKAIAGDSSVDDLDITDKSDASKVLKNPGDMDKMLSEAQACETK